MTAMSATAEYMKAERKLTIKHVSVLQKECNVQTEPNGPTIYCSSELKRVEVVPIDTLQESFLIYLPYVPT